MIMIKVEAKYFQVDESNLCILASTLSVRFTLWQIPNYIYMAGPDSLSSPLTRKN